MLAARGLLGRVRVIDLVGVRVELTPEAPKGSPAVEPHKEIEARILEEEDLMYGSSS